MKELDLAGVAVREWDEVSLTGYSTTCKRVVTMTGVVGAVCPADDDGPAAVKVWPHGPCPDLTAEEIVDGKIWFPAAGVTACRVIRRGDDE